MARISKRPLTTIVKAGAANPFEHLGLVMPEAEKCVAAYVARAKRRQPTMTSDEFNKFWEDCKRERDEHETHRLEALLRKPTGDGEH